MNVDRVQKDEVTFEVKPVAASGALILSKHDSNKGQLTITHADARTLWFRLGEVIDRD